MAQWSADDAAPAPAPAPAAAPADPLAEKRVAVDAVAALDAARAEVGQGRRGSATLRALGSSSSLEQRQCALDAVAELLRVASAARANAAAAEEEAGEATLPQPLFSDARPLIRPLAASPVPLTSALAARVQNLVQAADDDMACIPYSSETWTGRTASRGWSAMYIDAIGDAVWTKANALESLVSGLDSDVELLVVPCVLLLMFAVNRTMWLDARVRSDLAGGRRAATIRRTEAMLRDINAEVRSMFPSVFRTGDAIGHRSLIFIVGDIVPLYSHAKALVVKGSLDNQVAAVPAAAGPNAVALARSCLAAICTHDSATDTTSGTVVVMSKVGKRLVDAVFKAAAEEEDEEEEEEK